MTGPGVEVPGMIKAFCGFALFLGITGLLALGLVALFVLNSGFTLTDMFLVMFDEVF